MEMDLPLPRKARAWERLDSLYWVWKVTKLLVLLPPPHPCRLRSGPPCLVSITAVKPSPEYRIFVYSVHHCVPGTKNACWRVSYAVWLASFYCSPPTTTVSFLAWGHPPAENPSHTRQSSSSQMRKTWTFRVRPPLTHLYHLLSPRHSHAGHIKELTVPHFLLLLCSYLSSPPLHKMSGPTFALSNTHQIAPRPAETDGLCKTNCSFLSVPTLCKVL